MSKKDLICESIAVHEDIVKEVSEQMRGKAFPELSSFFKVFGDTTRVRILWALAKHEMCVCDISTLLGMSISAVSHQLRLLRNTNLVITRRVGKQIYYSLADDHVRTILNCGMEHISE